MKKYLIFLGVDYNRNVYQIEQYLPHYLAKYRKVVCFEYPRFITSFQLLLKNTKLFERKTPKLTIYHSFGLLPFGRRFLMINLLNHYLNYIILKFILKEVIQGFDIITFTPEFSLLSSLFKKTRIYYYILDEYKTLPWWNNLSAKIQFDILEAKLLQIASKLIVVSKTLYYKYKKKHLNISIFPTPANINFFFRQNKRKIKLLKLKKPIFGFVGSMYDWKVDLNFILRLVNNFEFATFVVLGEIKTKNKITFQNLVNKSNFFYIKYQPFDELPRYISQFDVCLIPYKTDKYGQAAYPVKLMEYLAMGKPVVTSAIPSIRNLAGKKLIYWSKNEDEFIKNLKNALSEKNNNNFVKLRITEAKRNDWSVRIRQFINIIEDK